MRDDSPLEIIWRRRVLIGATFLVFVVAAAVVSKSLEKVYSTHSTLLVALEADEQTFDSVQASQAFARSFAEIIDSPNIAGEVAVALGDGSSAREVGHATNFEPVSETQLLEIHAEDPDPARAKRIADTYATAFIDYARRNLAETTKVTISLADRAPLPRSPARPKPTLYTLIAAFFGLALGLALGFLRDRLDHRLRTSQDVESRFEAPVLARVPRRRRSKKSISAFLESYRVLRASLQFSTVASPARSIAVTSGEAGEGKTTTVMQLAIASAEMGLEVIVVEADFRRPGLQRAFMPDRVESLLPGFSNYLVGGASVEEVIHPTGLPNISIVPAGPLPPTPSALLESRFGNRATADLLSPADLILIDCPPLSAGADASLIATWVDGLIVVVDLGSSTDTTVRGALKSLEAAHARVLGLVLNRDPTSRRVATATTSKGRRSADSPAAANESRSSSRGSAPGNLPFRPLPGDLPALLGDRTLLWRGPGGGSDIDLVPVPGSEQALSESLWAAGLRPDRGDPGHVMWLAPGGERLPLDVLEPGAWPARYPPLAGVLARAREERGLLVASPEDRLLIFAADAVAGRRVAKLAERAEPLLAEAGVRDRLRTLGAEQRMEALARLATTLDRAEGVGRSGRLSWRSGLALGLRSGTVRAAARDRLAARLRRTGVGMRGRPRPGGLIIALSGIDGAGKSSAADAINARLAERGVPARVSWARLGNRSRLLNRIARPVKRLLRREGTVADPVAAGGPAITKARDVREAERRTPVGWAWVLVVAAVNVRDGRRAARSRRGGVAVICDRWTADALVDLRVRYGRHRAAEALISRALPRPDLAVLLEIDAETSRQRKPGDQADRVLVKMVDLYAETAGRLDLVRIDARRPIDEVVPQLHAAVDGIQAS